jgi:Xaa-Pro aminopeptidase
VDHLRGALRNDGLEAALVTDAPDVTYLSGFRGDSSYLLITQDYLWLITDSRYTEQAASEAPQFEVVQHELALVKSAARLFASSGARSLAFEPAALSFAAHAGLVEALDGHELTPKEGLVRKLREIKDEDEIERIRKAAEVADAAFRAICDRLAPGQRECEVANALEHEMRKAGARKGSFDAIVAARERASLPHAQATDGEIAPGDPVLIDWGAVRDLYCSDCTRVLFLERPDERWSEIYGIVLEAQKRAIATIRAGVALRDVDAVARSTIVQAGYGDHFGHGLGHGVGLCVHEGPSMNKRAEGALAEGMVVTVEPGIYLPGWGGVRIEDLVVVRADGPEVLSSMPKDLEAAVLS